MDCEYPMKCCDFIFASVCCNGGPLIPIPSIEKRYERSMKPQEQAIPIPIPVEDSPRERGGVPWESESGSGNGLPGSSGPTGPYSF